MKRCSCFATSVPSAPSAEPEKVRTVSFGLEVRAQAASKPASTSAAGCPTFTRYQTGKEARCPRRGTRSKSPPFGRAGAPQRRACEDTAPQRTPGRLTVALLNPRKDKLHREIRDIP